MEFCNDLNDVIEVIQRDIESRSLSPTLSWSNPVIGISPFTDYCGSRESESRCFEDFETLYDSDQDVFFDDDYVSSDSSKEIIPSTSDIIAPKNCLVCGDPTNCCHYDVPACSGCKTFFRRSVLMKKEFKPCKGNGNCDIAGGVRCRPCRFDKCVMSGMNAAAIKLPEDTNLDSILQKINQRKRKILENFEISKKNLIFEQTLEKRDIDFLVFLESKVVKLRESNYNPRSFYMETIPKILEKKTALRFSDKYEKPKNWPINFEKEKLKIHCNRNGFMKPPKRHWLAIDLILTIEMTKSIPIFEKLQFSDAEAAIKNALLVTTLLTQAYYSNLKNTGTMTMPDGMMPIILPLEEVTNLHFEVFCRILEPLKRINLTPEEYVLLKSIMLCNPAVKEISDKGRKLLEKESDRYSKILLKHMQSTLGLSPGAVRYSQIMQVFEAMAHFAQKHREFHHWLQIKFTKQGKKHHQKIQVMEEVLN